MHQWVQQKELNNKNEQSVVIIILVATLFFRHFLRIVGYHISGHRHAPI
ncbi:hypothetical protein COPCOM_01590 [Coprococcus comes ATCC 27758]|uniref:Uncharacterized protein n=1 Tax=Coprococcus comes ATCC 27758 TaxID=470146 RepID=C0B8W6_9FIRM|nr:hypothetical protein COPCOM_01590 [Coprococcus comes ATCC 27758]